MTAILTALLISLPTLLCVREARRYTPPAPTAPRPTRVSTYDPTAPRLPAIRRF